MTLSAQPGAIGGVGPLLRDWRLRRRLSQMDLALDVGVSPRHLSFVETGRSRPSPGVLQALADRLAVPLRERNRLLLAAGFAPRFTERRLDEAGMKRVRESLARMLKAHEPYPALVLDRAWNVVMANRPAQAWVALLPDSLTQPVLNVFRASLHPEGLAPLTENLDDWARYLIRTLRRAVEIDPSPVLVALEREVSAFPAVARLKASAARDGAVPDGVLVPCTLSMPSGRLSMFTTLTTFGTPLDITLEELCVELFYPADDATEALLRAAGASND